MSTSSSKATTKTTCVLCRNIKKKCDGLQPCSRCTRRKVSCIPAPVANRRVIPLSKPKIGLSVKSQLTSVGSALDRELLSDALLAKISAFKPLLKVTVDAKKLHFSTSVVPLYPLGLRPAVSVSDLCGDVHSEETEVGYAPVILRVTLTSVFETWDPERDGFSPHMSLYLVRLFLPYRSHFNFYIDIPSFLDRVILPPEDPLSVHPALLNAIYLTVCCLAGGRLISFRKYFQSELWRHLYRSLENADRLTHLLWASVVHGSYLTNIGHVNEAYAIISPCATFALACGFDGIVPLNSFTKPQFPLLPPPANAEEAADRTNLSYAIYMTDRNLSILTGLPSMFTTYTESTTKDPNMRQPGMDERRVDLDRILNGAAPLNIKAVQLFERVERLARIVQSTGEGTTQDIRDEFDALKSALEVFHRTLPSLLDNRGLAGSEAVSLVNPHVIVAHTSYHGSVLLLYSLFAEQDAGARGQVFEAARSLADVCSAMRGSRGLQKVRGFAAPMVHAMNATRVFASYLRSSEAKKGSQKLAVCCKSLTILVDYLFEATRLYPDWGYVMNTLQGLLFGEPVDKVASDPVP